MRPTGEARPAESNRGAAQGTASETGKRSRHRYANGAAAPPSLQKGVTAVVVHGQTSGNPVDLRDTHGASRPGYRRHPGFGTGERFRRRRLPGAEFPADSAR